MKEKSETNQRNLRIVLAIGLTCFPSWGATYLAIAIFKDYATGLFIWLPLVLGATSTMLLGYKNSRTKRSLRNISLLTLGFYTLGLLVFAWEGLICLIMVAPLAIPLTWIGHWIGYGIIKRSIKSIPLILVLIFASLPLLMAFQQAQPQDNELRSVTTSIEIDASPEQVWENVIAFPQLAGPTELLFKTGIAYPINATIDGKGVGAIRHCNFSTGSFVEPITVWDENRLLQFSVKTQPPPMKEISPYDIHPAHLDGYWVSKKGQFKLTKLPNGNTLLEGTTWYVNKIKPDFYWTLWSDYIVHKIHNRVLAHIKTTTESEAQ